MLASRRRTLWLWIPLSVATIALLAVGAALGTTVYAMPAGESLFAALLLAAGMLLVARFPRWAVTLVTIGAVGTVALSEATATAPWPVPVATLLAVLIVLGGATLHGRWRWATAGAAILGIAASSVASSAGGTLPPGPVIADLIVALSLAALIIGAAVLVRAISGARGELAAVKELTELELARRQIAEERTRIAREMHDVVAHGMSVIQVQSASARYRYPDLSTEVADEFDDLAATARTALGEMRALLGVLRADDGAERAPQPTLTDLPELTARSRATLDDQLPAALRNRMDPVCQLAVYRVVQESLGNSVRHAPGAATAVSLTGHAGPTEAPTRIRVTVRNAAPAASATPAALTADTSGHGIRGMRERVTALGGSLHAGPTPDGGFQVVALVPLTPGHREDTPA